MPASNPHHHHLQPSTQTASSQIFSTSQSESTKQPQICSTYSFFLMLDNNVNVVLGQFYLILQCNIFGSFLSSSYVVEKLSLNVLIWKLKDSKGEPEEVHWQDRCQIPNGLNILVGRLGSLRQCRSLKWQNERKCRKRRKVSSQKFNCAPFLQSYPSHHAQLS